MKRVFNWIFFANIATTAFRIYNAENITRLFASPAYFLPYDKGFVGYYGEPENPRRERVNEGAGFSGAFPRIWESDPERRRRFHHEVSTTTDLLV